MQHEISFLLNRPKDLAASRLKLNELLKRLGIKVRQPLNINNCTPTLFGLDSIRLFEASCEEIIKEEGGGDLHDTQRMLDYAFKAMGLTYSDDFAATIGTEDLVEGYDMENRQIFRNFQFMEICGYDLHDLLSNEWFELYERSHRISEVILERCMHVIKTGKTLSLEDLPTHYMKERSSEAKQISKVTFRHLGPVFRGPDNPIGVLISCKAAIVDEAPNRHELRFI